MTTTQLKQAQALLSGLDWASFHVTDAGRIRTTLPLVGDMCCPLQAWHGSYAGYIDAARSALGGSNQMVYEVMAAADYDGHPVNRTEPDYRGSRDLRRWMLAQMRAAKRRRR